MLLLLHADNFFLVQPLSEFVYVNEEGDILDHDPIIGVLQLRQTPSTGKFWVVGESITWL